MFLGGGEAGALMRALDWSRTGRVRGPAATEAVKSAFSEVHVTSTTEGTTVVLERRLAT